MSQTIPAIYDAGVFKPLVPVQLAEGTRVEIDVRMPAPTAAYSAERLRQFVADMEALPDVSPNDGFSNRDHDLLIYGF
jgi:predicted DNA-binding antitoxin AbrB/MazE fold protein